MFYGKLFLNTSSSTKFHLNPEFGIATEFRERTKTESHEISIVEGGEDKSTTNRATKKISELLGYVSEHKNQENEFICEARVKAIENRKGWNYIACSTCSKKIEKTKTSLSCFNCNNPQAIGILRFQIQMIVDDGNGSTTFVLFDREAKNIINKSASEINNEEEIGDAETISECVRAIVGRTFIFQIKVTTYNFSALDQSFTLSRILEENRKEGEKTILGDGENIKANKCEREGDKLQKMKDDEEQNETVNVAAVSEDQKQKRIKKEDISKDVMYAGLRKKI